MKKDNLHEVKRILEEHLLAINGNTSEIQGVFDYLHEIEIKMDKLSQRLDIKRITLVPTAIYTKKGKIKLEIALAKGKMEFEKRETIRKKDLMREQEKILKNIN